MDLKETDRYLRQPRINYEENLYKRMDDFRRQEILCDTILQVDGQEFPAHKNVLAACSEYFLGLFTSDMKEKHQLEVKLEGFRAFVMNDLLHYIYTGEVEITDENVKELVFAADYLLITSLKDKGSEYLEGILNPSNCLSMRAFSEKFDCEELMDKSESFILENFVAVSKSEEFLHLCLSEIEKLITLDDVIVETEEQVYEAVVSWVKHDVNNRRENFPRLLSQVRLGCMSKYYIAEYVEKEELVTNNLECTKLLYEAMKSYALHGPQRQPIRDICKTRKCLDSKVDAIITIWGPGDELRSSTQCYVPSVNQWYNLAPMLIPRFSHGAVACEGFIFTVGGVSLNGHLSSMERYDYRTNTWAGVAPMAKEISALGVAELNGSLYAVGGWHRGRPLNTVLRYYPNSNIWEAVAPMTSNRGGPCVVSDKYLYAIGGKTENDNANDPFKYLSTVEKYDPRTNTWTMTTPMQVRRAYACGVAVGGNLYVVGGTQDDLYSSHSSCEAFDIENNTWTYIANLCISRALAGIAFVGNHIYVLGGKKNSRERTDKVEFYDIDLDVWKVVGSVPNCMGGIQCSAVSLSTQFLNSLTKIT